MQTHIHTHYRPRRRRRLARRSKRDSRRFVVMLRQSSVLRRLESRPRRRLRRRPWYVEYVCVCMCVCVEKVCGDAEAKRG